ncbi:MAG TPA: hypothetical protein VF727_10165 [Allosphingosinicella sp.]
MNALSILVAASALTTPATAFAKIPSPAAQPAAQPEDVTPPATDVPGETLNLVSGGAADLEIDPKKSELTLGYAWAARLQEVEADGFTANVVKDSVSVELTLPLGGGDNLLKREAFDGLADGPSLSFSWTRFQTRSGDPWDLGRNARLRRIVADTVALCKQQVEAGQAEDYTFEKCERSGEMPTNPFLRRFPVMSIAALNRALLSPVSGFGIEASIGADRYEHRTPVTLAENRNTKVQYSAKAYAILFPSDGVSMLTASVSYENSYEAKDETVLCRAVIADPRADCVKASSGPPTNVEKLPLELEYRRTFQSIKGLGQFAIAPRAAFDALSNDYELELPIFLKLAGRNTIVPGASVSYDSRHGEVIFGFFLRKPFKF